MRKNRKITLLDVRAMWRLDMMPDYVSLSHDGDVLPPSLSGDDWAALGPTG